MKPTVCDKCDRSTLLFPITCEKRHLRGDNKTGVSQVPKCHGPSSEQRAAFRPAGHPSTARGVQLGAAILIPNQTAGPVSLGIQRDFVGSVASRVANSGPIWR